VAGQNGHRGYLGRVPARDVASYAFDYRNFRTYTTLSRIERIYGMDYDAFGYARDARRYSTRREGLRDLLRALLRRTPAR